MNDNEEYNDPFFDEEEAHEEEDQLMIDIATRCNCGAYRVEEGHVFQYSDCYC